ncbi:carbon-sulfur lyase [Reticulomyxa filosa]|uniref:Carbon-sulfur lyase n=1 Tax=Reticulomyxa filosa TaxID=46433 RepID=X6NNV5_RETFI|nr:carbon-sulfur lyase [Reticulomyxa filosa]|eukprot:ETO27945.1 carbon-sulfur lyase [Reticulomyxa filosa]
MSANSRYSGVELPSPLISFQNNHKAEESSRDLSVEVTHEGGCHCGAVKWEFVGGESLTVWDCNCSICRMKGNFHTIIPKSKFKLLSDPSNLTTYTFNTKQAKHMFCKKCGVQSFYHPRSNPDGIGIQVYCIQSKTIKNITFATYNGLNWEDAYKKLETTISQFSKL